MEERDGYDCGPECYGAPNAEGVLETDRFEEVGC